MAESVDRRQQTYRVGSRQGGSRRELHFERKTIKRITNKVTGRLTTAPYYQPIKNINTMDKLKQMAADFGFEYAEKHNLIKRNPLLGFTVACIYADGFQFGFNYEGTKEDWKENCGDLAMKYVEERDAEIMKKDPLLGIGFIIAYKGGVEKGIAERDAVQFDHDEQGNIIGISTNKNTKQ